MHARRSGSRGGRWWRATVRMEGRERVRCIADGAGIALPELERRIATRVAMMDAIVCRGPGVES